MELRYSSSATQQARAKTATERAFNILEHRRGIVIAPGSTSPRTDLDSTYSDSTGATIDRVGDVEAVGLLAGQAVTFNNLDTTVATFDELGNCVERLTDGTCRVQATALGFKRQLSIAIARETPTTATTFTGFASGSFGLDYSAYLDGLIGGRDAGTPAKNRFSAGTTPNPDNFAAGVDLSCVSIEQPRLTLVSPLHAISTAHLGAGEGAAYTWRGTDGTLHARTITAAENLPGFVAGVPTYSTYHLDVRVYRLSEPLPDVVTPARVLPAGWRPTYAPGLANGIPAIGFNGDHNFVTDFFDNASSANLTPLEMAAFARSTYSAKRAEFFESFASSSNPLLLVRGAATAPIVVSLQSFANSTGPDLSTRAAGINTIMATQGGGHQLTMADLSTYTDFA